jgi:hypothetical protein
MIRASIAIEVDVRAVDVSTRWPGKNYDCAKKKNCERVSGEAGINAVVSR